MATEKETKPTLAEQLGTIPVTQAMFKAQFANAIRLINLALEKINAKVDARLAKIKDGYTPKKGVDYFDGNPGYTPVKGKDYFDGQPGKAGHSPVAGVDYVIPKMPDELMIESRLREQLIPLLTEEVSKNLPVLGVAMRDALELLQGEERLDYTAIRDLEKLFEHPHLKKKLDEYGMGGGWGVIGVQGISVGAGLSIDNGNLQFPKITLTNPSSTFYPDTVSGTIDGSNRVFTVPNTINAAMVLFLSGTPYQPVVDFAVTGAKQITFVSAPDASLSGMPFWLLHT